MDLDNIKTFVTVANLGNYTKAAEELNYAQSTITSQIQQLEQELKFPLFERIGRKNYLTAGGQEFLPHAVEIMHIMQKSKVAGQDPGEVEGRLRIGVLESLLFSGVLGILPEFRREYPRVDVMIKIGQAADLLELLRQNQLDIAYVSYGHNSDASILCAYSRREEMAFMAAADHPLAGKKHLSIAEVMDYPFVVAEKSGRCYGRLARLDVDCPPQVYYSQILYHKNKYLPPYAVSFIEHIRRYRPEIE